MAGHGSPPPPDRSVDPSRSVTRDSGMLREESEGGLIREYRPPIGAGPLSDRGTRYGWDVAANGATLGMSAVNGRGGSVRTLKRARAAVSSGKRRLSEGRDLYTGR